MFRWLYVLAAAMLGLAACGGGGSTEPTANGTFGTAAVTERGLPPALPASPPAAVEDGLGPATSPPVLMQAMSGFGGYDAALATLAGALRGTLPSDVAFAPQAFLARPNLADCFDAGVIIDAATAGGNACAVAAMGMQMTSAGRRSTQALLGLAAMVQAARSHGIALPAPGRTLNLVAPMNALDIADTRFTGATLTLDARGARWRYALAFSYVDAGVVHAVRIALEHEPGAAADHYLGVLHYQVDDEFAGGRCAGTDVSYNGSIYFEREGRRLRLNARDALYCGHGRDAGKVADAALDGHPVLDPAETYDAASGRGWAGHFSILAATLDPVTLAGDYTYAWQPGPDDGSSRVLSIAAAVGSDGETYHGYGAPLRHSDGAIHGSFCRRSGDVDPLQGHALLLPVLYDPAGAGYAAPPGSCLYVGTPANFWQDADGDGVAEAPAVTAFYPEVTGAAADSLAAFDTNGDGRATIAEYLAGRGFVQPVL